jgi:sec-independent protein translocase protein TatA
MDVNVRSSPRELKLRVQAQEARMFESLTQPIHLLILLCVALLIFGPSQFNDMGKDPGEGTRGFKDALKDGAEKKRQPSVLDK